MFRYWVRLIHGRGVSQPSQEMRPSKAFACYEAERTTVTLSLTGDSWLVARSAVVMECEEQRKQTIQIGKALDDTMGTGLRKWMRRRISVIHTARSFANLVWTNKPRHGVKCMRTTLRTSVMAQVSQRGVIQVQNLDLGQKNKTNWLLVFDFGF